jgi:hypothetical protein
MRKDWAKIGEIIDRNHESLFEEYSETIITVSDDDKWDFAIPENYTNYQDGFLFPNSDSYRGQPIFNYNGTILYLRWNVSIYALKDNEREKYCCFDRTGKKYLVVITKTQTEGGNPSYFRFLPRVKKYERRRTEK